MKSYPVIVIYNEKCSESPSCTALIGLGIKPLIVDNSTKEMGNAGFCLSNGLDYISMNGNAGLPKAYNAAVKEIRKKDADGFVIWLDDDTELDSSYFAQLENSVSEYPDAEVFVPVVYSRLKAGYILSPCVKDEHKAYNLRPVRSIDEIEEGAIASAINSGMAVKLSVFDSYSYDENMFLDFVDHDFMRSMAMNGVKVHAMKNTALYQNYSGHERTSVTRAKVRDNIYRKDYRLYGKKAGIPRLLIEKRLFNQRIALYLRHLK